MKRRLVWGICLLAVVVVGLLYATFFKVTHPSDPKFNIAHFKFEDYKRNEDIIFVMQKYLHLGMSRAEVENFILKAGGVESRSGSFSEIEKYPGYGYGMPRGYQQIIGIQAQAYTDYIMPIKVLFDITPGRSRKITAIYGDNDELKLLFVSGIITLPKIEESK